MDVNWLFDSAAGPEQETPERRILVATLACIAESGLQGSTVRAIAAKAGMNGASVNYYYRSKEKLVEAALRSAWIHVSEDIERIRRTTQDPREALTLAIRYVVEGGFRYPKIIRAIMEGSASLRGEAVAYFGSLFKDLGSQTVAASSGLATALLMSFTVFMGIAPDGIGALTDVDLSNPAGRDLLAARLTSRLFDALEKQSPAPR